MSELSAYKKHKKPETLTTSVVIEVSQKEFIDSNELNLSSIVREAINRLMNGKPGGTKNEQPS